MLDEILYKEQLDQVKEYVKKINIFRLQKLLKYLVVIQMMNF